MEYADNFDEKKYPAVVPAYDVALKSYDWILHRANAVEGAIDKLLILISSINTGVVAIVATKPELISFDSFWFFISAGLFLMCITLGFIAKIQGWLRLPSPEFIYHKWLHLSEGEFKKNALYSAGEDFKKNCRQVNTKAYFGIAMTVMFLLNIATLGIWIISSLQT